MASTKKPGFKVETKAVVERKRRKSDLVIMWQCFCDVTATIGFELWLMALKFWEMTKLWFRTSEKMQLLTWLERYLIYAPDDFTDCWRDGRLLCILLNRLQPGCLPDANRLDPDYGLRNVYRAFDVLESHFDITPNVTAEEIVTCATGSDQKLFKILLRLKEMTTYSAEGVENTIHEVKEEPIQQPPVVKHCIVKGTGLAVGFVGKMTNFIIFCSSLADLDIVIEIKGPSDTVCCERITKRSPMRRLSASLWDSPRIHPITRSTSYNENINSRNLLENLLEATVKESMVIPMEYEIQGNQINVGYKPVCKGRHRIAILWRGLHISDSPYEVIVEEPTEMSTTGNKTHLKSALKSTNYEEKHNFKSTSVRFKDNVKEKEYLGKVLNKKVLRYIVKIGNQDVAVEADNTESLATELLKMDYEFDKCPTFYRRNSWGFAGEAERKRSVIRQFHVDVSELEAQSSQRRSNSLSLNPNSKKSLRKSGSIEDLASQTRLRTVAEGTAKDFNKHEFLGSENEDAFAYVTEDADSVFEEMNVEESALDRKEAERNDIYDSQTTCEEAMQSVNEIMLIEEPLQIETKHVELQTALSNEQAMISSLSAAVIQENAEILSDDLQRNKIANDLKRNSQVENSLKEKEDNELTKLCNDAHNNNVITSTPKPTNDYNEINDVRHKYYLPKYHKFYKCHKFRKNNAHRRGTSCCNTKVKSPKFKCNKKSAKSDYITFADESSVSSNYSEGSIKSKFKQKRISSKFNKRLPTKQSSNLNHESGSKLLKSKRILNLIDYIKDISGNEILNSEYSSINKFKECKISLHTFNPLNSSLLKAKNNASVTGCDHNSLPIPASKGINAAAKGKNNCWPHRYLRTDYTEQPITNGKERGIKEQLFLKNEFNYLRTSNIPQSQHNISSTFEDRLLPTLSIKSTVNSSQNSPLKTHVLLPIRQYNFKQFNPPSENFTKVSSVKNRILQWEQTLSDEKQNLSPKRLPIIHTENMNVKSKLTFWEKVSKSAENSEVQSSKSPSENQQIINIRLKSQTREDRPNPAAESINLDNTGEKSILEDTPVFVGKEKSNSINKEEKIPSKKQADDKLSAELSKSPAVQRRSFSDPGVLERAKENFEDCYDPPATLSSRERNIDSFNDIYNILDSSSTDDELSAHNLQVSTEDEYIDDEIPESASDFWGDLTLLKGLKNFAITGYEDFHSDSDIFKNRLQNAKAYPSECKVYGIAIYYGYVAIKNKFQVLTKEAGCGNLSASVQGFGRHDVTFVSVAYVKKDIYEVTYQVMTPGHYLISVRWMDSPVPGSPFICKVTF